MVLAAYSLTGNQKHQEKTFNWAPFLVTLGETWLANNVMTMAYLIDHMDTRVSIWHPSRMFVSERMWDRNFVAIKQKKFYSRSFNKFHRSGQEISTVTLYKNGLLRIVSAFGKVTFKYERLHHLATACTLTKALCTQQTNITTAC